MSTLETLLCMDFSTGIKQRLHISETNMVARDRYVLARRGAPQSSPRGARLQQAEVLNHYLVGTLHTQTLLPDGVGEPLVKRQLIAPVLQIKHAKVAVESFRIDSMLPFNLAVVARGRDANTLIFDPQVCECLLKQG